MMDTQKSELQSSGKTAFVIGYTGETGKALVKELDLQKIFKRVVLIGRRKVDQLQPEDDSFEQHVIDFENMSAHAASFKQDVGFCCLGTTNAKAKGKEGFRRVDYDYVLQSAQLAQEQGCQHFHLVTSAGANSRSSMFYMKVKGQVEEAVTALELPRVSIYRPKALLCKREEFRIGELFLRCLCAFCLCCCPSSIGTPTDLLARAMINNTAVSGAPSREILLNHAIYALDDK